MNSTNNYWIFRADVLWIKHVLTIIFIFGLINSVSGKYLVNVNNKHD